MRGAGVPALSPSRVAASAEDCSRSSVTTLVSSAADAMRSPAKRRKKARREGSTGVVTAASVPDDARHPPALEPVAAMEEVGLHEERQPDHDALEALDELDRALDRPARGEEIVDDQHPLARLDRVAMDLEGV